METKIIEHKLKQITIEYSYNNNPWTDEDEALVNALVLMYDRELAMNDASDALMTDYHAANRETEELREELGKVAAALTQLRSDADNLRQYFGLPSSQPFIDLGRLAEQVTNQIKPFRNKVVLREGKMAKLHNRLDEAIIEQEDLSLWDEYSEIKYRHCDHSENNSISITHYRTVDEERKQQGEHHARHRRNNSERCREIHHDNQYFIMEACVQLALWDEFVKRLMVLGYIFGRKEMLPGVWEN